MDASDPDLNRGVGGREREDQENPTLRGQYARRPVPGHRDEPDTDHLRSRWMEHGLAQHHLGPGHRTRAWRGPPAGSNHATVVIVDGEEGFGYSAALISEPRGLGESGSRNRVWVNLPPLAGPDRDRWSGPSARSPSALALAPRQCGRCSHRLKVSRLNGRGHISGWWRPLGGARSGPAL